MKKLMITMFAIMLFTCPAMSAYASAALMTSAQEWCDPNTTWCVFFKGDASVGPEIAVGHLVVDATGSKMEPYHAEGDDVRFSATQYSTWYAQMQAIRDLDVNWIRYQVTMVNGKTVENVNNCLVSATKPISPGYHTLMFSKTATGYSCRVIS